MRVTVKNRVADSYTKDVHVKVIGSANRQFVSGETDLRGIFVADAIRGTSTVIAKAGKNRYAFYRGKTPLGNVPPTGSASRKPAPQKKPAQKGRKGDLLKNIRSQNTIFNRDNRKQYQQLLDNKSRGVKAKDAFK